MQENPPAVTQEVADIYNSAEVVSSSITPTTKARVVTRKSRINTQTRSMKTMRAQHDGHTTLGIMSKAGFIDDPFANKTNVTKASTINDLFGLTNAVRTAVLSISKGVLGMTNDPTIAKFPADVVNVITENANLVGKDGVAIIKRIEGVEANIQELANVADADWTDEHYMHSLTVGTDVMDIQELLDNTIVLYYAEIQAHYSGGLAVLKLNAATETV